MAELGTLYGIGAGPGDPSLITLKAKDILGRVDMVFAAGSTKNDYSLALNIVQEHLSRSAQTRYLGFPMSSDQEVLDAAWQTNAETVLKVLETGKDAAFVTLGDTLTYSTYGYLIQTLRAIAPEVKIVTVPGITAFAAAAARLNQPLCESKESLLVVSGVNDPEEITRLAGCADNLVIMKAYKTYDGIIDALEALPSKRPAMTVSNCCLPDETVHQDAYELKGTKMPYLSLILVKGKAEQDKE